MAFAEDELQHSEIGPFVSGPLDVGGVGQSAGYSFFPSGYSPPSIGSRHKARHLPAGSYSGRLVDSRPSGFGLALWGGVRKYDGQWESGLEHGVGREAWSTGSCYSGGFLDGLRSGFGVYGHCASPEMFEMLRARPEMDGAFAWCKTSPYSQKWAMSRSGWLYAGQMRYGGRHGFGAMATPDGELYEGQFNEDKKHGFGVRMVRDEELWLEAYDEGECRISYSPMKREGLTVHVEASLNRLRWAAAKMSLSWQKGVASVTILDKMTGSPLGSRIMIPDVISLKIGDPITHSFILQYTDSERIKRTLEIQAGSDASFRLIFLALRLAIYEHRVRPLSAPLDAEWFKDLSGQDPSKLLGRFIRGSEGLDERFFQKVRESVARADTEHRRAFYFVCLSYVKMTISASAHLHKVWGLGHDETFQVTADDFADPDQWLLEQSLNKPGTPGSPASAISLHSVERNDIVSDDPATEILMDRTIVFLRRCDSLVSQKIEGIEQKRDTADSSNDKASAKTQEIRMTALEAKQNWASHAVSILEQCTEGLHQGLHCTFGHLSFLAHELAPSVAYQDTLTPNADQKANRSATQYPPDTGEKEEDSAKSPSRTRYAAHDMTHSIMMRRSAITTAMLLQSRRQREIVDLEYAEAEKLLKDAKGQLEQSQAAQRAITLEMKQRAEAAESLSSSFQDMYQVSQKEAQEYLGFNETLVHRYDRFMQRTIKLVRARKNRQLLRSAVQLWHAHSKVVSRMVFSAKKIILRWYNLRVFRSFETWRNRSFATKRLRTKARAVILKLSNSKLLEAWHTWTDMVERQGRLRMIGLRAITRWRSLLLSEAFVMWENQVPSRNLEMQMEKRLSTEVQLGKLLQDHQDLLARLLQAEDELQQHRDRVAFLHGKSQDAAQRVLLKLLNRPMMTCFNKWAAVVCHARGYKAKGLKVLARWAGMNMYVAFSWWKETSVQETRLARCALKIISRWRGRAMSNSFILWHIRASDAARARRRTKTVVRRWMKCSMFAAMHTWMAELTVKKKLRRVIKHWHNRCLLSAWYRWREAVGRKQRHAVILQRWKCRGFLPTWLCWEQRVGEARRNRAILKRWSSRALLPAFLRWVENFIEIRRQVAIINKIVRRWSNKTLAAALSKWIGGMDEDVRVRIIFTKVMLRWTRHSLRATFCQWRLHVEQQARDLHLMYKIAMRWTNMRLDAAFERWHSFSVAKERVREDYTRMCKEMLHSAQEIMPFVFLNETIVLEIAKLKGSMGDTMAQEHVQVGDDDEPIFVKKNPRVARATRGAPVAPSPVALPAPSSLVQGESQLQSVYHTASTACARGVSEGDHAKIVYSAEWNTICFELDKPPAMEHVTLKQRDAAPTSSTGGKALARFKRAVRSVIMARRFQASAAKVGISITNDAPHSVLKVTELMDMNGRLQGEAGYCNAWMKPGDVLYAINGTYLNTLPIGGVKDILFGPPNSTVKLHMRRQDGSSYDVVAMRHMAITQAGIDEMHRRNEKRLAQRSVLGSQSTHNSPPELYRSNDSMRNTKTRSVPSANPFTSAINSLSSALGSPPLGADLHGRVASLSPLNMFSSPPEPRSADLPEGRLRQQPPRSGSYGSVQTYSRISQHNIPQHRGAPPGYPFPHPQQSLYSSYSSTSSGHAQQAGVGESMEFGRFDKSNNSVLF